MRKRENETKYGKIKINTQNEVGLKQGGGGVLYERDVFKDEGSCI